MSETGGGETWVVCITQDEIPEVLSESRTCRRCGTGLWLSARLAAEVADARFVCLACMTRAVEELTDEGLSRGDIDRLRAAAIDYLAEPWH